MYFITTFAYSLFHQDIEPETEYSGFPNVKPRRQKHDSHSVLDVEILKTSEKAIYALT